MDISIIGANGSTGKHLAARILLERLLLPTDRLQLVGHQQGSSGKALYGFRQDLRDAFDEHCPIIDIALTPEEVVADIIVMAAGSTIAPNSTPGSPPPSRDELARHNLGIALPYAEALARYGHGHEVVIVVSNPVELMVAIFAQRYDRHRVMGMGAYQDSLRFRREIARSLNVPRGAVRAMVLGEHGDHLVPLWSSVAIQGFSGSETARAIQHLRSSDRSVDFPEAVRWARRAVLESAARGDLAAAFEQFHTLPPDLRVVIGPFLTLYSGSKTDIATANATIDLIKSIASGKDTVVATQVQLDGELPGFHGPIGAPVLINTKGWETVHEIGLTSGEHVLLQQSANTVNEKLRQWQK
ncbi:malate dehydrogenase [Acidithiobacillus acidisediminis]|uniref:malate dehydrogenase n=1 Tax=Acidithiobacillus acidisediminis TaxID=2937799 RepID=UPI00200BDA7D